MKIKTRCNLTVAITLAWGVFAGAACAQVQPAETDATTPTPTPAQYARDLLKKSADRLSAAKSFAFKVVSSAESPSSGGPMITYFSAAEVAVQRPNKLMAKRTGDGPTFDLYYDGKTFSAMDTKLGLYAQMDAPPTLDALIAAVMEKIGLPLAYADFLYSDVFAALTNGVTYADTVGTAIVNGVPCVHLVFAGPDIEWQIWLGPEDDPLPRRLAVTYLDDERRPRFMVTFSDWDLNARLSADRFELKPPAGAQLIEFRPHPAQANN